MFWFVFGSFVCSFGKESFFFFFPSLQDDFDFCICDNANSVANSYSNLENAFFRSDYPYESTEAQSFLAGAQKFTVLEIEVFCKF